MSKNLHSDGKGKWHLIPDSSLEIGRAISVSFGHDNFGNGMLFHLSENEYLPTDNPSVVEIRSYIPDQAPSPESFEAWVFQSVNKTAINIYDNTVNELRLAQNLNSTYLTDDQLKSDLLRINTQPKKQSIESFALESFLNYEIPFVENLDPGRLMQIKENEEIFTNFRLEFQKNLRDLRSLDDVDLLHERIESLYHEFYSVQVNKIDQKFAQLKRQMGATAVISLASIIPAFATSGVSLLGLVYAGAKGFKEYDKYRENVSSNPAFIFWRTKKSKSR